MFGKNKGLTGGAQTQGVVFWKFGPRPTDQGGHADPYSVQARIKFDDGTTRDTKKTKLHRSKHGFHLVGETVPVRYDPADHSNVEIDLAALAAEHAGAKEQLQRSRDAALERALNEQPATGPSADESP